MQAGSSQVKGGDATAELQSALQPTAQRQPDGSRQQAGQGAPQPATGPSISWPWHYSQQQPQPHGRPANATTQALPPLVRPPVMSQQQLPPSAVIQTGLPGQTQQQPPKTGSRPQNSADGLPASQLHSRPAQAPEAARLPNPGQVPQQFMQPLAMQYFQAIASSAAGPQGGQGLPLHAGSLQQIRPGVSQVVPMQPAGRPQMPPIMQPPGLAQAWRGMPGGQAALVGRSQPAFAAALGQPGAPGAASFLAAASAAANAGSTLPHPLKKPGQRLTKAQQAALTAKKHCNCKNSRCLKLYCECFASGRYCDNCNCVSCCNNKENESFRQAAIETILDRNPNAFRPKIQERDGSAMAIQPARHNKGCNCKKSGCLKKYCECFQASIYCSENCKCVDCKNFNAALGPRSASAAKQTKAPEALAGVSSSTRALKETMQEIVQNNGISEMASLLLLVAGEEADAFHTQAERREDAGAQAEPSHDQQGQQPSGSGAELFEAQEGAILHEFHSFLAKLVERVGKRATEYEAAAALQQASTGGPGSGGPSSRRKPPAASGQSGGGKGQQTDGKPSQPAESPSARGAALPAQPVAGGSQRPGLSQPPGSGQAGSGSKDAGSGPSMQAPTAPSV